MPAHVQNLAVRRVVVMGAESTGTTTLTRALATHYQAQGEPWAKTTWIPEYGRDYTFQKLAQARQVEPRAGMEDLVWTTQDFVAIARAHIASEERALAAGAPLIFCDTDALATAVWHERYLGSWSVQVEAIAKASQPDLYLVTDHADVPFEPDAIRDGEHLRAWMTARFLTILAQGGHPHVLLRGSHVQRLQQAINEVESLLSRASPCAGRTSPAPPGSGGPASP